MVKLPKGRKQLVYNLYLITDNDISMHLQNEFQQLSHKFYADELQSNPN